MTTAIKGWRERAGLPASYKITNPSSVERALLEEIAELQKAVDSMRPDAIYGCHCDLEPHMQPDECVIGTPRSGDCAYARRHTAKEQCVYWQKITQTSEASA